MRVGYAVAASLSVLEVAVLAVPHAVANKAADAFGVDRGSGKVHPIGLLDTILRSASGGAQTAIKQLVTVGVALIIFGPTVGARPTVRPCPPSLCAGRVPKRS